MSKENTVVPDSGFGDSLNPNGSSVGTTAPQPQEAAGPDDADAFELGFDLLPLADDASTSFISTSTASTSTQTPNASNGSEDHNRLQEYEERLKTYKEPNAWQRELCTVGFCQDGVWYRCFSCAYSFHYRDEMTQRLMKDCESWKFHAQRSPECQHIITSRGIDFIKDCNRATECQSLEERLSENERANAQKFHSLQEDIRGVDTQSTLRTETLRQDLDGVKTKVDVMETRQQASDVNARTNEREISDQVEALKLRQYADSYKNIEGQQKLFTDLEEYKKETDGRFQDFAGANNTVVTTQPPPPDVQPEPMTPVTSAVDDGSEADAEVTDVQPAPESNPGNR